MMRRRGAAATEPPKRQRVVDQDSVRPFWNHESRNWSSHLPYALRNLEVLGWSTSSAQLGRNSWFDVVMHKSESPVDSRIVSDAVEREIPALEQQPDWVFRSIRVLLYLTPEQKTKLNQWFGAVRFCYNKLVEKNALVGSGGVSLKSMRQVIKDLREEHDWLREIPSAILDVAVRDMDKARRAHFAKPESKRLAKFKFRSKKDAQQSFEVQKSEMRRKRGMFASLALDKLRCAEKLPESLDAAIRFVRDRLGRYYIVVPRKVQRGNIQAPPKVVALDPGVRTFQTTYDATGLATEWGKGGMSVIFCLCRRADKLQSSMAKKTGSKKRGCRRAWWRMLDKIRNKVDEIHHKTAKWLCDNYTSILIPKFEVSRMVKKSNRKISSAVTRNMLTWAHFRFREFLKSKAQLRAGVSVVEVNEAYTSKTCGLCGELHSTLGSSKTFKCAKCGYVADRDINGARNILLRYLTLHCKR